MRKADRLFQLVNLIRVHQPISAERLASRMEVSVRSIYRYIDDLSVSGIPIFGTPGVGYSLDEGFELAPLTLNTLERNALILGVEMLAACADQELGTAARTLLDKISASLTHLQAETVSATVRAMNVTAPATRDHLKTLRHAIEASLGVQMTYLSLDDEPSQRLIFPLGLFYWGGKWTVGSWCCTRNTYRDFRVDRITSLTPTEHAAPDAPALALHIYMRHQADQWQALTATDSTLSV